MKIPTEIRDKYTKYDPETALFLDQFDEEVGKLLEVGSHDAPIASMLSESGFRVFGVDLRECDQNKNYTHIVGDFCNLPNEFWMVHRNSFDVVVSVSALEHFGLVTYNEGALCRMYDVMAVRYMWDALREGGVLYVTVPYGGRYVEQPTHWRTYDWSSLVDRIIQDFSVELFVVAAVEEFKSISKIIKPNESNLNFMDVLLRINGEPFISVLLKLRKGGTKRKYKEHKRSTPGNKPSHQELEGFIHK